MNDFTIIPRYAVLDPAVTYTLPPFLTATTGMDALTHAPYKVGITFSKSYLGYVHAVAHSLGGQYNIPHGLANSVLLPIVLKEYGSTVYRKLHVLGVAAGVCKKEDSHKEAAEAKYADKEANPLYPVPKLMNVRELEKLYELVSEGESDGEADK